MKIRREPRESHKTAAWAGIMKKKRRSQVMIPSEWEVIEAKEYVDSNEK